jgi:hypothetical protein
MARKNTRTPKPVIVVNSIAWSGDEVKILKRLAQDATDVIGRTISTSAVLRAAVRWLGTQGTGFSREHLIPLIESELGQVHWGKKKGS